MQQRQQILVVVNPISANKDKSAVINSLQRTAELENFELLVYETKGESDRLKLPEFIEREDPDRVISIGGDGTIKLIAEVLEDVSIPIGIIPAGSANGLAVNLGLPLDPIEANKVALGDHFLNMDAIEIEDELCLHMSDFGLNAELIRNYEASNLRGKIGYLVQSLPTLIRSNYPYNFTIEAGGKTLQKEGVLLGIANAQMYGTGANVNPNAKLDDGRFEILIFKNLDPLEILKTLRNQDDLDPRFIERISVKEAKISCKNPVPFQIDGEYRGEKESLRVKISDKKFKIAVPEKFLKSKK